MQINPARGGLCDGRAHFMNLNDTRTEYMSEPLEREDLRDDPVAQFAAWYQEAAQAGVADPNAMTLCTVSPNGWPSSRTVLLKQFDAQGFVFFTNLESRKASEIAANPNVSLLFPWLPLFRQVSINGVAEKVSAADTLAYFLKRPFGSRVAAAISPQSRRITTRALLEAKWEEAKRKFADGRVPLPSFWGGFRVVPREIEFWQGGENRLHDRFLYMRQDDGWRIERLAP